MERPCWVNDNECRVIRFAPNQPLPTGWVVLQLDSGHYIGSNGEQDTAITVNRFRARKWAIQLSRQKEGA